MVNEATENWNIEFNYTIWQLQYVLRDKIYIMFRTRRKSHNQDKYGTETPDKKTSKKTQEKVNKRARKRFGK